MGFGTQYMTDDTGFDGSPIDPAVTAAPNFLTSSWDKIHGWFKGKNANTAGMSPSMADTAQAGQSLQNINLITGVLQGINSAIGTFYAAKAAQYEQRSQASSFAFQSNMASINASRAETMAESIQEAGKSQVAAYTMQAGQQKAGATASMAARGIALGVGSARDVAASMDVEKDLNVLAINSNTTRQAWEAREKGADYQNEATLDRMGVVNALSSAKSISPAGSAVNTLLGSATQISQRWDYTQWLRQRLAAGMPITPVEIGN